MKSFAAFLNGVIISLHLRTRLRTHFHVPTIQTNSFLFGDYIYITDITKNNAAVITAAVITTHHESALMFKIKMTVKLSRDCAAMPSAHATLGYLVYKSKGILHTRWNIQCSYIVFGLKRGISDDISNT